MTSLASSPWRTAWAERENDRRRRAYRDATDSWRRRNDHLVRLRIEAAGFLGCTQPRTGLPVDLDDDELVFRVVPVAELVEAEARHIPGLPTPGGHCAFADVVREALPTGLRVVDAGLAVVTSRRVAFAGRECRREWRYADLVGAAHHPDVPVTLLHDHGGLSGLLVPVNAVVNFRFYLTLAATGDRAALTAHLDALLSAHQAARPTPLPMVGPDEAPPTAVRPDRRMTAVAAVTAVVIATLGPGAFGAEQQGRSAQASPVADVPAAVQVQVPARPIGPVLPGGPASPVRPAAPGGPAAPVPVVPPAGVVGRAAPSAPARPVVQAARPVAVAPTPAVVPSPPPVPTPGPAPTASPTPALPMPSASVTPSAPAASPTPSPSDSTLVTVCLDPLQLPLLCRSAAR
ncbi:hypothetical protein F8271_00450 [Micromonospora sp. ALFpr18c]|uniref:hypothetical protein n=1 Tax=unclassified Micromonospora TaxID=2617518 RepID=UPI00124B7107|nr:hypothetical protein [Micromonospora sp. ALFpr18c]KAB1949744.1 hypothetical protein F8271_00450 [Micromonospora sp. ALFpr18c]